MVIDASWLGHSPDLAFGAGRTKRLVIRRFRPEDAASLAAYRSDPLVARYQSWEAPFAREEADAFIERLGVANPDTVGEWFQFAVEEAATGQHLGDVAVGVDVGDPRLVTMGVTMARSAQGRGIATEAVTWLFDYLFVERGKHRVTAECDVRNRRVIALFDRLGMRREGHHLQRAEWKGEWVDEYVYALLSHEWAAARATVGERNE